MPDEEKVEETPVEETTETVEETTASPYEEEYNKIKAEKEKLEADLVEKERQIVLKDKALEKKAEPKIDEESLTNKILSNLEAKQNAREAKQMIESMTDDPKAREVIQYHFDKLIVQTGDIAKDVKRAFASANADRVEQITEQERLASEMENQSASSMSASGSRGSSHARTPMTAADREAQELSEMVAGGDAEKAKRLTEMAQARLRRR